MYILYVGLSFLILLPLPTLEVHITISYFKKIVEKKYQKKIVEKNLYEEKICRMNISILC